MFWFNNIIIKGEIAVLHSDDLVLQQVNGRRDAIELTVTELKDIWEEGLLDDSFYVVKFFNEPTWRAKIYQCVLINIVDNNAVFSIITGNKYHGMNEQEITVPFDNDSYAGSWKVFSQENGIDDVCKIVTERWIYKFIVDDLRELANEPVKPLYIKYSDWHVSLTVTEDMDSEQLDEIEVRREAAKAMYFPEWLWEELEFTYVTLDKILDYFADDVIDMSAEFILVNRVEENEKRGRIVYHCKIHAIINSSIVFKSRCGKLIHIMSDDFNSDKWLVHYMKSDVITGDFDTEGSYEGAIYRVIIDEFRSPDMVDDERLSEEKVEYYHPIEIKFAKDF
jgi:hypothetical protein